MLLQSIPFEYRWNHSAVSGLFARNMARSTHLPVATWSARSRDPRPVLLITFHSGPDWLLRELPADGISTESLGPALGGELLRFTPVPSPTPPTP